MDGAHSIFEMTRRCGDAPMRLPCPTEKKSNLCKIIGGNYCFVFEFFVPLHRQNERTQAAVLKIKIVRFKSRICAH